MQPFMKVAIAWFRRNLTWSNSRQSWQERFAVCFLVVVASGLYCYGSTFERSQQVILWGILLASSAFLFRRGWLKLFGPVLFYDIIRTARRSRYVLLRFFYAGFLFLMLLSVYARYFDPSGTEIPAREMAQFAQSFFYTFMTVQFLAILLLTPAYTASAIAEEKDRKTLEFLLATDLRNREIVLSKQVSRFGNLTLLIITGLPILSITQFLGGVDPDLVLAGFAATGLTMASITSLSTTLSVYAKKPRDAIVLSYLTIVAYLGLSALSHILLAFPTVASTALFWGSQPWTVADLIEAVNAGNLATVWFKLGFAISGGQSLADTLPGYLRHYAIFHGLVTAICTVWAVVRVRAVALKQTYGTAQKSKIPGRMSKPPQIGNRPMVWKEVRSERGIRLNWFGRIAMAILVITSFVPAVWIGCYYYLEPQRSREWVEVGQAINIWLRVAGTAVACLMLIAVAVRASGTVGGERDRQTLDSLLTSPLDSGEILYGKWLGSILSVRWAWIWLGLIWAIGVISGGLLAPAILALVISWFVFAGFLAALGMWFSVVCRTTLRANILTLVFTGLLGVGHWIPWMTCCIPIRLATNSGKDVEHLGYFQLYGLTPPATLALLAIQGEELGHTSNWHNPLEYCFDVVFGLLCWCLGGLALWRATGQRFRRMTNRLPYLRRRPAPPPIAKPPVGPLEEVIPVNEP